MNPEDDDMVGEIREIGRLLDSGMLLLTVRQEVSRVMSGGFSVTDGSRHVSSTGYEVVVKCGCDEVSVARRIRANVPDVKVERIADGVLGISHARRVR